MTVPQSFDSLIAKLIVTGASRQQALERARRALAEFEVDGMPTVLPFHRAVVNDPAFTSEPFSVHTRWIETEFDGHIPPYSRPARGSRAAGATGRGGRRSPARERIVVEVGGKRLEVVIPAALAGGGLGSPGGRSQAAGRPAGRARRPGSGAAGQPARAPAARAATRWSARCRARSSRSWLRKASR